NPRGRPRGSQNIAAVFIKTLKEKVVINEHGQRKTISKLQASVKQLINKAASGDLRALHLLINLSHEAEAREQSVADKPSAFEELDQKVVASILRRFHNGTEKRGVNHAKSDTE